MAQLVGAAAVSIAVGQASKAIMSPRGNASGQRGAERAIISSSNVDLTLPAAREPDNALGSPLSVSTAQDGPQIGLFGRRRVGGRIVFAGTSQSTGLYYMIIVLAGDPVSTVHGVYVNNTLVAIDGSQLVTTPPWNLSSMSVAVYTGGQTTADAVMSSAFPGWTSQFVGEGQTYVRIRINKSLSPNGYAAGVPDFTFDVSGFAAYDPRNSAHSLSNRATWQPTSNAALITANYLVHELGAALPTSLVDWDSVAAAADICDQTVTTLSGTESRYTSALVWNTDERHETVLARAGAAHGGGAYLVGDRYRVIAASYSEPTAAITPAEYEGSGLTWDDYTPLAVSCNGVRGVFSSPLHNYETKDFPPYVDTAALAEDGGVARWIDVDLSAVVSHTQAQRLAKIALNRARRGTAANVELQFTHFDTVAGDTVTVTDELAGFTSKPFRVLSESLSPDFVVRLGLQADEQAFYVFNASTDEKPFTYAGSIDTGGGGSGGGVIGTVYGSASGDSGPLLRGGGAAYDASGTSGYIVPAIDVWPSPNTGGPTYRLRLVYSRTDRSYRRVGAAWVLTSESTTNYTVDRIVSTGGGHGWDIGLQDTENITYVSGQPNGRTTVNFAILDMLVQTEKGGDTTGFVSLWAGGSLDNQTNPGTRVPFSMPCVCSPYVASGSGGSWTLRTNGVYSSRPSTIELYRFNSLSVDSGYSMVGNTTNPGAGSFANFNISGSAGVGYYYRTRTADYGFNLVSPWSSPLLLVFQ